MMRAADERRNRTMSLALTGSDLTIDDVVRASETGALGAMASQYSPPATRASSCSHASRLSFSGIALTAWLSTSACVTI